MKISMEWLNSYLPKPCEAQRVQHLLIHQSFPIDSCKRIDGQTILDVEVTSNRPDCLSHLGLAREVAAATRQRLKPPEGRLPKASATAAEKIGSVQNEDQELCPLYTARIVQGVKVGPSPHWLVERLAGIGLRSVNNIVDLTNFVLHESGQPLHAFDLGRLKGAKIVVRRARDGESMTAIDGTKAVLKKSMLVIADATRPVAIAGVMGGLDTEVSENTRDILLESAQFQPLSVRRTSRRLKLFSDSSYRFERGVDPHGVDAASRRAAALILELAGGELANGILKVGKKLDSSPHHVTMRIRRCNRLLGVNLEAAQMADYLEALDLAPQQQGDGIRCTIPSFRLDLHREVDLIEEIGRLHGFHRIEVQTKMPIIARPLQRNLAARQKLGEILIAHGYHETINFSFIDPKIADRFVLESHQPVMVDDDRRKAEPMLRPALLPSLLQCRKRNQDGGNREVKLFETAAVWNASNSKVVEQEQLALLADAEDAIQTLRSMRGTIQELIEQLAGGGKITTRPAHHPYLAEAVEVLMADRSIGFLGLVAPQIQQQFDLQTATAAAQFDLPALIGGSPPQRQVRALPRYPAIERDLSIVVDCKLPWMQIEKELADARPDLLDAITFITSYRGKPIPAGRKSVSFRLSFRHPGKTLRHDEVDPQLQKVVQRLEKRVGAELRK